MTRYASALAIAVLAATASAAAAQSDPVVRVLTQEDAPVTITEYTASYSEGGSYGRRGIRYELAYRNDTDRRIRAVKLGLVSFNVFNDFLDRTSGISMDDIAPGGTDTGTWIATSLASFSFFTGLSYVAAVRFYDGEIWEADMDPILTQIRQIEADFEAARLSEEPSDPDGG